MAIETITVEVPGTQGPAWDWHDDEEFIALVNSRLAYETKAEMDAAGAPSNGQLAEVWGDETTANNRMYGWDADAGEWVVSEFDDLTELQTDVTELQTDVIELQTDVTELQAAMLTYSDPVLDSGAYSGVNPPLMEGVHGWGGALTYSGETFNVIKAHLVVPDGGCNVRVGIRQSDWDTEICSSGSQFVGETGWVTFDLPMTIDSDVVTGDAVYVWYEDPEHESIVRHGGSYSGAYNDAVADAIYPTKYFLRTSWVNTATNISHVPRVELLSMEMVDVVALRSEVESISLDLVNIVLPDEYVAVAGQTIQLFYHSMIEHLSPYQYNIVIQCGSGNAYSRYFEWTPEVADVGNHSFTISLFRADNEMVGTATAIIKVVEKQSPESNKNILCVGDSLCNSLTDWGGLLATMMVDGTAALDSLPVSNVCFIGEDGEAGKQWVGYGGQSWSQYNTEQSADTTVADVWVYATGHDKTEADDQESVWLDSGGNSWQLETVGGDWLFFKRMDHTSALPSPVAALTHESNATHRSDILYSDVKYESRNPFWDNDTGEVSFAGWFAKRFAEKNNAGEGIDVVVGLMGWNSAPQLKTAEDEWNNVIADVKTFIDNVHADYPSATVCLMGLQYPSLNGGLGQNYTPTSTSLANVWATIQGVNALAQAYQTLANSDETSGTSGDAYSSFVRYVDVKGQFDSENNMPASEHAVNLRSTTTELRGTNGVHPTQEGYYQIADAAYRALMDVLA